MLPHPLGLVTSTWLIASWLLLYCVGYQSALYRKRLSQEVILLFADLGTPMPFEMLLMYVRSNLLLLLVTRSQLQATLDKLICAGALRIFETPLVNEAGESLILYGPRCTTEETIANLMEQLSQDV